MKMQKKLNIVLIILTVILVSLISFGGIYYRNKNVMANRIPEYLIGTDLKGHRQIVLNPVSEEDTTSDSEQENNEEENENETEENVVAQDKEEKQYAEILQIAKDSFEATGSNYGEGRIYETIKRVNQEQGRA